MEACRETYWKKVVGVKFALILIRSLCIILASAFLVPSLKRCIQRLLMVFVASIGKMTNETFVPLLWKKIETFFFFLNKIKYFDSNLWKNFISFIFFLNFFSFSSLNFHSCFDSILRLFLFFIYFPIFLSFPIYEHLFFLLFFLSFFSTTIFLFLFFQGHTWENLSSSFYFCPNAPD